MKTFALHSDDRLARYDYLSRLSPDRWAWEFLRRNRRFRRDAAARKDADISERRAPCEDIRLLRARTPQTLAERWGLVLMPDPALDGYHADVVWNPFAFPDQVTVHPVPRAPEEHCEIHDRSVRECAVTHITDAAGREYLLLRKNGHVIQIRSVGVSFLGIEPVRINLTLPDLESYKRRLKLQEAAIQIFSEEETAPAAQWTKTTQILRDGLVALDCLDSGMTRRDVAVMLHGAERVDEEWEGSSMKFSIRYLAQKAAALRDGGYMMELLGGEHGPARPVRGETA